jgi:N-acetylglucosamine-6-phosphate deacetylase
VRLGVAAAIVDGALVRGDIEVHDGIVAAAGLERGGRGLAIPGMVDLQVHGYAGVDVLRAEPGELLELGRALARDGVLAYQPTLISAPPETLRDALAAIGQAVRSAAGRPRSSAHTSRARSSPPLATAPTRRSGCAVPTSTCSPRSSSAAAPSRR